jgi:hypothetical protein
VSTPEDAIRLLGRLDEADRRWLLERLPESARARLAEHIESDAALPNVIPEPALDRSEEFDWRRSIAQLSVANAASMVNTLAAEPAWIVDAVLNAADWPWRREVQKNLPPALRAEITSLEREPARLALPAVRVLVRELALRAQDWPPAQPAPSGLRGIFARLRGEAST